jgi:hypothetical protein
VGGIRQSVVRRRAEVRRIRVEDGHEVDLCVELGTQPPLYDNDNSPSRGIQR